MNKRSIIILICFFALLTVAGVVYQILSREPKAKQYDNLEILFPGIEISALLMTERGCGQEQRKGYTYLTGIPGQL